MFVELAYEVQKAEVKWHDLSSEEVLTDMVKEFCKKVQYSIDWVSLPYQNAVEKFAKEMDEQLNSEDAQFEGKVKKLLKDDQPQLWSVAQKCIASKTGLLVNGVPGAGKSLVLSV